MTKRDFIFLIVTPIILLAIAFDLLWLSSRLHDGAERRLADYAVLQDRVSGHAGTDSAAKASERAAFTLSRLAVESHESDAAIVTVSTSLAVLLLVVSLLQMLTVMRLLRKQQKASAPRPEIATSKSSPLRPPGVSAARASLTNAGNQTIL